MLDFPLIPLITGVIILIGLAFALWGAYWFLFRIPLERWFVSAALPTTVYREMGQRAPVQSLGLLAIFPFLVWAPFAVAVLIELAAWPGGTAGCLPDIQAALAGQRGNPLVWAFSWPIRSATPEQLSTASGFMRVLVAAQWLVSSTLLVAVLRDPRSNESPDSRRLFVRSTVAFLLAAGVYLVHALAWSVRS